MIIRVYYSCARLAMCCAWRSVFCASAPWMGIPSSTLAPGQSFLMKRTLLPMPLSACRPLFHVHHNHPRNIRPKSGYCNHWRVHQSVACGVSGMPSRSSSLMQTTMSVSIPLIAPFENGVLWFDMCSASPSRLRVLKCVTIWFTMSKYMVYRC